MGDKNPWVQVNAELPPPHVIVDTKIDDAEGVRNECALKRIGKLWFELTGTMHMYYTPTHWRYHAMGKDHNA